MGDSQSTGNKPSQLALGCSALARAGQLLSGVKQADQAPAALAEVDKLLGTDARLREVSAIANLAAQCRKARSNGQDAQIVTVCRQLAADMARQSGLLAKQIQEQASGAKPAPTAPRPVAAQAQPAKRPQEPVTPPVPQPAAVPDVQHAAQTRITVAVTAEEKSAVAQALKSEQRFAVVGNNTVIDTKTNLMWVGRVGPTSSYSVAEQQVEGCRLGDYTNWRLPTSSELQDLTRDGGWEFARSTEMFRCPATGLTGQHIWSAESRRRWLILREAACLSLSTGEIAWQKIGSKGCHALPVRGAP